MRNVWQAVLYQFSWPQVVVLQHCWLDDRAVLNKAPTCSNYIVRLWIGSQSLWESFSLSIFHVVQLWLNVPEIQNHVWPLALLVPQLELQDSIWYHVVQHLFSGNSQFKGQLTLTCCCCFGAAKPVSNGPVVSWHSMRQWCCGYLHWRERGCHDGQTI